MTALLALGSGWTSGIVAAGGDPMSHVLPHDLLEVFGGSLRNHIFMLFVTMVLLLIFVPLAARKKDIIPKGFRNFLEALMQVIREQVARPVLGKKTDTFIPYLWTFFFTILLANLLGMIPLGAMVSGITADKALAHWGGTATGNISVTVGLGIAAFFLIHVGGMAVHGVGGYWKYFFFGHAPAFLAPLMIPLELAGAAVKPAALAVRLCANMTAGHIILAVLIGFGVAAAKLGGGYLGVTAASVLGAMVFSVLEVFVAFLQAYIFTFLLTLFLGAAVIHDHH